jgi:hypothetical protein
MSNNTEPVTLVLPRNEMRLLVPAIMDRMTMSSHDRHEGRLTDSEFCSIWDAHQNLLIAIREVLHDG